MSHKYIVSISGGLGSAEALRRVIEQYGKENVVAVFADVKGTGEHLWSKMPTVSRLLHERFGGESLDTYRFIWMLSYHFDIPIERLETNESIWDVFVRRQALRIVINRNFFCPASEELKRSVIADWIQKNFEAGTFTMVLGMGWQEEHRLKNSLKYWTNKLGYAPEIIAPNMDKPYVENPHIAAYFLRHEIEIPSAYGLKFSHNNCGGGCVQAGQGHFALLYKERFEVYMYWAVMEMLVQQALGHNYTILKDERGGKTKKLSLLDFIQRIQAGDYRKNDQAACACFGNLDELEAYIAGKRIQTRLDLEDK